MSKTSKKRKLTSLELSAPARGALARLTRKTGWTKTHVIETALFEAEKRWYPKGPVL